MQYSLTYRLGGFVGALDPDAVAWIDAVIAAGGTLYDSAAATKQLASDYFTALKTDSTGNLHALLGRDYHPVWQVAAANAICAKSLTSGTFVGTVTHGVGFVQGDGSTGYFNTGISPNSLGLSPSSAMFGCVLTTSPSATGMRTFGCQTGTASLDTFETTSEELRTGSYGVVFNASLPAGFARTSGIILNSRQSLTSCKLIVRQSSGVFVSAEQTAAASGSISDSLVGMARNSGGAITAFSNGRHAGFFAGGTNVNHAMSEKFTLIRKQFYEALTGLTIP